LIQELSFPVYRRVVTMIVEMVRIDPGDLLAAQDRDAQLPQTTPAGAQSENRERPR